MQPPLFQFAYFYPSIVSKNDAYFNRNNNAGMYIHHEKTYNAAPSSLLKAINRYKQSSSRPQIKKRIIETYA
jgi:hypothetical protein